MKGWQLFFLSSFLMGLVFCGGALQSKEQVADQDSKEVVGPDFLKPPPPPTFKKIPIPPYKSPLADVSSEQAFNALAPFFAIGDIDNSIKLMKDLSSKQVAAIIREVIKRKVVSRDNLLRLLFGVLVAYFKTDASAQERLLDLIIHHEDLQKGPPLLFVAAQHGHAKIAPGIIVWGQRYQKRTKKQAPSIVKNLTYNALKHAILNNDVKSMNALLASGVLITPKQASQLLWHVAITKDANPGFVRLLKYKKADLEYAKNGHTLLMKAVVADNLPLVKALVKSGAKVDAMIKLDVGTALQLSIENERIAIEEYLREQGAG